jgi:hypothetical protein
MEFRHDETLKRRRERRANKRLSAQETMEEAVSRALLCTERCRGRNKKWARIRKSFTFSTLTQFMSAFKINSLAQEVGIPITFSNCTYNCFGTLFLAFKFEDKIELADLGGDVRNFFDQGEVVGLCWLFGEMMRWRNDGIFKRCFKLLNWNFRFIRFSF